MRIAIIGAGGAGLASAKCCLDANLDFDVFEQTGTVGGTWNYCEKIGVDENGLAIHTSMYQNLKTNLPKEVMAMDGLPYSQSIEKSYLTHTEVLNYIHEYSNHFHLHKFIKFFKQVTKVKLRDGKKFSVQIKDVITKETNEALYSHVIVCNGHFFDYTIPDLEGLGSFTGKITHSHDYRIPTPYKDKTVVVIGCGPSGLNISEDIAGVAKKVFLSHSREIKELPCNILYKPSVKKIHLDKIIFMDYSEECVDEILFCTGYDYTFPFLDPNCGIEIIEKKYVRPLYKHVINAKYPNMAFIGIPFKVCPFPMFSLQSSLDEFNMNIILQQERAHDLNALSPNGELSIQIKRQRIFVNYLESKDYYITEPKPIDELSRLIKAGIANSTHVKFGNAKFFLATIVGNFKLPSKEDMLKEIEDFEKEMKEKNIPLRHCHAMDNKMGDYFNQLADTAKIARLPPVINKLYNTARMNRNIQNCYKILDDETFIQIK